MIFATRYNCVIFLLLALGFANIATAQPEPAVAMVNWRNTHLQERLYVHTSKNMLVPGETMWFSVYYVDGVTHEPLRLSSIAYLDLLDSSGTAVAAVKVSLADSAQSGSMQIPANLRPGYYRLRCYTRWMRNFDAANFCERVLIIGATPVKSDVLQHPHSIEVYPEGGKLVYGLESRLAIHIRGDHGREIACDGVIIDAADTVKKFSTATNGLADIFFTPLAGHLYRVQADTGMKQVEQLLNPISNQGSVLRVTKTEEDGVKLDIHTNDATTTSLDLIAHTRGKIVIATKVPITNGSGQLLVDGRTLGDGVTHFTLFRNGRPVNDRLVFHTSPRLFNISAKADANEYGVRKKVIIHLATNRRDTLKNKFSVAVYRCDSISMTTYVDLQSNLMLDAEVSSAIGSAGSHYGTIDTSALDLFLLSAVDKVFKWDKILTQKTPALQYAPELNGEQVLADVKDKSTDRPVAGLRTYLSVPGTDSKFWSAVSNSEGIAMFETGVLFGNRQYVVQLADSNAVINLRSPFAEADTTRMDGSYDSLNANSAFVLRQRLYQQVRQSYSAGQAINANNMTLAETPFYFKSDVSYQLNRYTRFRTLEEVMREYIREINVTNVRGSFHLQVYDELRHGPFQADPLVLLDGVVMTDLDKFMAYDPLKIRTIDIVTKRYYLGDLHYDGIIDCKTYHGDLDEFPLSAKTLITDADGLQVPQQPASPRYETAQKSGSRMPDFRTLLYWNPALKNIDLSGKDIEFYTSDAAGNYVVVVEGLSEDGAPATTRVWFNVKK